jgi:hypothetical protein
MAFTLPSWPRSTFMHWPSLMLHSRMVPSAEAVNRRSPYILNTRIRAEWPSNTFTLAHASAPATTTITTITTTTTITTITSTTE